MRWEHERAENELVLWTGGRSFGKFAVVTRCRVGITRSVVKTIPSVVSTVRLSRG